MTIINIATLGFSAGIVALGLFFAWMFRREPGKALNIGVLSVGLALLTYEHLQWEARHESREVKQAMFIRQLVAGWGLFGMGFVGLQCRGRKDKE